jgi:hypothetical protein
MGFRVIFPNLPTSDTRFAHSSIGGALSLFFGLYSPGHGANAKLRENTSTAFATAGRLAADLLLQTNEY